MAEKEGENPFSFKKFVKKKDQDDKSGSDSLSDEEDDIFDIPDTQNSNTNDKPSSEVVEAKECNIEPRQPKKAENPFSFKKFLQVSVPGAKPKVQVGYGSSPPDVASDLPDFVQDHYVAPDTLKSKPMKQYKNIELPDFTKSSSSRLTLETNQSRKQNESVIEPRGVAVGDDIDLFNEISETKDRSRVSSRLPDFLPDGAFNTNESYVDPEDFPSSIRRQHASSSEARVVNGYTPKVTLQEEKRILKQELLDSQNQVKLKTKKLADMFEDIKRIKKRESEDTAALANMVQQVEANLVSTTDRAVQAESLVSKLKQEVKGLQQQLNAVMADNNASKSGDLTVMSMREKALYVSEQLKMATSTAEQSLKQLLQGTESLKMLSQVLESIDKITDAPASAQPNS